MSGKFTFSGELLKKEIQKTQKGFAFSIFQVTDNENTLDFSAFQGLHNTVQRVPIGAQITVNGTLTSNAYTDKNGKERFGPRLSVESIQATAPSKDAQQPAADSFNDIPF